MLLGHSAYNAIEHASSLLSQSLTGVTLPNHLPNELHSEQRLADEEQHVKETQVFDQAIGIPNGYWNGKRFDGHPVKSIGVPCVISEQQYTDHQVFEDFSHSSFRAIADDPKLQEMQELLKFLCHHAAKSPYLCSFLRCKTDSCQHCSKLPIRSTSGVVPLLHAAGGRLFTPMPSQYLPGHYSTFLEACLALKAGKPLQEINAGISKALSICEFGCKNIFMSKRDQDRHHHLVHPAELSNARTGRHQILRQTIQRKRRAIGVHLKDVVWLSARTIS